MIKPRMSKPPRGAGLCVWFCPKCGKKHQTKRLCAMHIRRNHEEEKR